MLLKYSILKIYTHTSFSLYNFLLVGCFDMMFVNIIFYYIECVNSFFCEFIYILTEFNSL